MSDNSKIEWTDATWNPVTGCSVVSPGCTNCYAMGLAGTRLRNHTSRAGLTIDSKAGPVWNGQVRLNEDWLTQPLKWRRARMIFVCAHGDLFHEAVPDEWIDRVFAVMALSPQHTFQLLTKRAKRMREWAASRFTDGCRGAIEHRARQIARDVGIVIPPGKTLASPDPFPHVWLGVSAEDQTRADERVPDLLATPAAVRFVSAEPLLGPIDFSEWMKGRAHGDSKERRGNRVPARAGGGTDDRPGGADMAPFGAASGSLDREDESHPLRGTAASGTRHREISHRKSDDRREADDGLRTQAGLAPFQRPDPERIDSQSQGRSEEDQSSVELGTSDTFRTDDSRDRGLGLSTGAQLSWVIVGGESGPSARPMHPDWPRGIRDQCAAAGVAFFFKQWGRWVEETQSPDDVVLPGKSSYFWGKSGPSVYDLGKTRTGRLLDGRTHDDMPEKAR